MYLKLFFWHEPLTLIHELSETQTIFQFPSLLEITGILSLIAISLKSRKKTPLISFGIFWFLICLLPKFYARLRFPAMEHHFYLAGIGLYLVIAYLLNHPAYYKYKYRMYPLILFILIFSLLTIARNYEYSSLMRFWQITARRAAYSYTPHLGLGIEYQKLNQWDKAEQEFEKTVILAKYTRDKIKGKVNLSTIYKKQGKFKEAKKILEEVTSLEKPPMGTWRNLGVLYLNTGENQKALAAWEKELSLYPQSAGTYMNIGLYYLKNNELEEAEYSFKKGLEHNPDQYLGYYGLGKIYHLKNDFKNAIEFYEKSLALEDKSAKLYHALGIAYARTNNPLAAAYLLKTIELDPLLAPAYNDLAALLASLDPPDWQAAREFAAKAQKLGYPVPEGLLNLIDENISLK